MIFPINANKIEQLDLDPIKKINGYVWFNTVEKVYKTWVDETLEVFLTDKLFTTNINEYVDNELNKHQFAFSFTDTYSINIKHNKNTTFFNYNVFDTNLNENISVSISIIDENEVKIDLIDPITGYIVMYFQ